MRIRHVCWAVGTLLLLAPQFAAARPAQGLGIYVGTARHHSETSISGIPLTFTYDSKGTGYGLDFQLPVGDSISINPFYMTSSESGDLFNEAPVDSADITNSVIGLEARFWAGDSLFLGLHAGLYKQSIKFTQYVPEEGSGTGFGATVGAEVELSSKVRLFAAGQYDSVSSMDVLDGFSNSSMTGLRIHLGLRLVTGP